MDNIQHFRIEGGGIFSLVLGGLVQPLVDQNIVFDKLYISKNPKWNLDNHQKVNEFDFIFDQHTSKQTTPVDLNRSQFLYDCSIVHDANFHQYHNTFYRLPFNNKLTNIINSDLDNYNNTLGVHIRLTSMNTLTKSKVPHRSIEEYITGIDTILERHPNISTIYVASDNHESIKKLQLHYDKYKIVFDQNMLRYETEQIINQKDVRKTSYIEVENWYDARLWEQAFTDCVFLSNCKYFFMAQSSLSSMAAVISKINQYIFCFNNKQGDLINLVKDGN